MEGIVLEQRDSSGMEAILWNGGMALEQRHDPGNLRLNWGGGNLTRSSRKTESYSGAQGVETGGRSSPLQIG